MRHARAADYRRRLTEKREHWNLAIQSLSFKGVPGLGSGEVSFASPVSAICGPNGVGKSTLLKLIWAALDPARALKELENVAKLTLGGGTVVINRDGAAISCTVEFPGDPTEFQRIEDIEVTHIDTAADVGRIQKIFAPITDIEAFLNGAGPVELNARELSEINYLTRRDYDKATIYEVELSDETVPFCIVTSFGKTYDSRTMGSGEFASFLIWWHLRRAANSSILLMEEPESFLSPASRSALIDVVLKTAYEKKICLAMTSHSSEIIVPLPESSVRFFKRDKSGVQLAHDAKSPFLLKMIGIEAHVDTLIFVEDEAARTFTQLLFEKFRPSFSQRIEIVVTGGEGEIVKILKSLESRYRSMNFVGLFDGDQKGKLPKDIAQSAFFLPGAHPIEHIFRSLVQDHMQKCVTELATGDISDLVFSLGGTDHHDWFEGLAKGLNLQKNQLLLSLFKVWMSIEGSEAEAKEAFSQIEAFLDPELASPSSVNGNVATEP